MELQRLFTSSAMNPALEANASPATVYGPGTANSGPSGIAGGITAQHAPVGGALTVQFPTVAAGGGILVKNNGIHEARLFYDDTAPAGLPAYAVAANRGGGGRATIPAGQFIILTDTVLGPIATYTGGPLSIMAGTFQYAVLAQPADHPNATVKA